MEILDLIEDYFAQDLELAIMESNMEFSDWLIENELYYLEEDASPNSNNGYLQWKINMQNDMKKNGMALVQYAMTQASKEGQFFHQYINLLTDPKQYPVKKNVKMNNAPNYITALQRINIPVATSLSNVDSMRVDSNNKKTANNLSIKKIVIPSYDGSSNFKSYAKNYYYGADGNRITMSPEQCSQLLPLAFRYCTTFVQRIKTMDSDVGRFIRYLNTDPSTGAIESDVNSNMQNAQAQQQQQMPAKQGMANTNPNNNMIGKPINADTNFEWFMNDYFGIGNWDKELNTFHEINSIQQPQQSNNQPNNKIPGSSNIAGPNNRHTQSQAPAPNTNNTPKENKSNKKTNERTMAVKKHRIVCSIMKDAFDAKWTAMGMLYRDFLYLCKAHVASYTGKSQQARQTQI